MTETGSSAPHSSGKGDDSASCSPHLEAWWKFDEDAGAVVADSSGNGHHLTANGDPTWTVGGRFGGAIVLDGATRWLSTAGPVLHTDKSFSVAAWVRLDAEAMNESVQLPPGEYAVTAVSQDGPSHSPFYLGARLSAETVPGGTTESVLRWDFTVAPVDGRVTGTIEWPHAAASPVDISMLGEWVLLVGVYDLPASTTQLFVPSTGDSGAALLPEGWTFWNAEGGFQVGQARYLDKIVDLWPGSIGPVRAYSGVLTAEDATSLYLHDALSTD